MDRSAPGSPPHSAPDAFPPLAPSDVALDESDEARCSDKESDAAEPTFATITRRLGAVRVAGVPLLGDDAAGRSDDGGDGDSDDDGGSEDGGDSDGGGCARAARGVDAHVRRMALGRVLTPPKGPRLEFGDEGASPGGGGETSPRRAPSPEPRLSSLRVQLGESVALQLQRLRERQRTRRPAQRPQLGPHPVLDPRRSGPAPRTRRSFVEKTLLSKGLFCRKDSLPRKDRR
mmetsp:Transcript_5144/g.18213  ORF Transcript_5144/g.18213 Transcript_5144/m.18213 type:complete len:231 (-) Transcript_5144:726-1418(-)